MPFGFNSIVSKTGHRKRARQKGRGNVIWAIDFDGAEFNGILQANLSFFTEISESR
jgi:hypothetical protein